MTEQSNARVETSDEYAESVQTVNNLMTRLETELAKPQHNIRVIRRYHTMLKFATDDMLRELKAAIPVNKRGVKPE